MPAGFVEIDTGGGRDISFLKHLLGERETVRSKTADIGIEIECAVRWHQMVEPGRGKSGNEKIAIGAIDALVGFKFLDAVESADGSHLSNRWW